MPVQVLVIDDDRTDLMAIRRYLSRFVKDLELHEAVTAEAGLAMMAERQYDCVIVDYLLPDMDGVDFLRRLYDTDADGLPAPTIMLTGEGSEKVMSEALRWGVHDYIPKNNISVDTLQIALVKAREMYSLRKTRRRMEEMLNHAQKLDAVGQLTSGIAHDFNNLLTVILGNTRLMRRRLAPGQDEVAAKIDVIEETARRGAELVRHLMVFARQRELKEEVADVNRCVLDACALLKRSIGERVEVRTELSPQPLSVRIDTGQLAHALINIAVNARDAMPEGGVLSLSTAEEGGRALITVSDTGTGMPESVRRRIFEPFYTTKPAGEGTGLGLSMVYGFISQSGGTIEVDSAEGAGTTFRIRLPLQKSAAQPEKESVHAG